MGDILWKLLANTDSSFYTSLRGAGFIPWESGKFINFDSSALTYEELMRLSFDSEFSEYVFSAVAEADELIFKTFDVGYLKGG